MPDLQAYLVRHHGVTALRHYGEFSKNDWFTYNLKMQNVKMKNKKNTRNHVNAKMQICIFIHNDLHSAGAAASPVGGIPARTTT